MILFGQVFSWLIIHWHSLASGETCSGSKHFFLTILAMKTFSFGHFPSHRKGIIYMQAHAKFQVCSGENKIFLLSLAFFNAVFHLNDCCEYKAVHLIQNQTLFCLLIHPLTYFLTEEGKGKSSRRGLQDKAVTDSLFVCFLQQLLQFVFAWVSSNSTPKGRKFSNSIHEARASLCWTSFDFSLNLALSNPVNQQAWKPPSSRVRELLLLSLTISAHLKICLLL